mgnify:CR=1 FL=1
MVRIVHNGKTYDILKGRRFQDIVQEVFKESLQDVIAVSLEGTLLDIDSPVECGGEVRVIRTDDPEAVGIVRHSSAHLMAQAVKRLFKGARLAIGPATDAGFYYDIDIDAPLNQEDLTRIEEEMARIREENLPIERLEIAKKEAVKLFEGMGEHYKVELLKEIKEETVSLYKQGEFVDLCRGPHVPSTGMLRAFKLESLAGAYWRGNEHNPMLQRIYGLAFPKEEQLKEQLAFLEEVKRRDHRRLGAQLELFAVSGKVGGGLILWLPNGALLREFIEQDLKTRQKRTGYQFVVTPHVALSELWRTSGHLDFYEQSMFPAMELEGASYRVKPMNCPFHTQIYEQRVRSYRDLPFRLAEFGTVYRFERSGTLHGLLRVRGFTQDDAHIFCKPSDLSAEIESILTLMEELYRQYHFDRYEVFLSTRPERYVGDEESWDLSTRALESALKAKGIAYRVDPGEGVFYGPKIDVKVLDSIGRLWQCTTIQVDFNLPERFGLVYTDIDGTRKPPIMVHRALLGSLERFVGILTEHYAGHFPFWLAPVQALIVPVSQAQLSYAKEIASFLSEKDLRVQVDETDERLGLKIRRSELKKIPAVLVVGKNEEASGTISVRVTGSGKTQTMSREQILTIFWAAVASRAKELSMIGVG